MSSRILFEIKYLVGNIFEFIKTFILIPMSVMFAIFLVIIGLYAFELNFNYNNDKTIGTLKIDGKEVYKGRTFFIWIDSIGENGNTKHVVIYRDKYHLYPIKEYVSDKVEIK